MEQFLILLACHFIGDFPFQSRWLSENKAKSWEINFYHVVVYVAVFIPFLINYCTPTLVNFNLYLSQKTQ